MNAETITLDIPSAMEIKGPEIKTVATYEGKVKNQPKAQVKEAGQV